MSPSSSGAGGTTPPGGAAAQEPNLWRRFAEATTDEEFFRTWLALEGRMIGGASGGVVVLRRVSSDLPKVAAIWPEGYASDHVRGAAERAFEQRKGLVTRTELDDGDRESLLLAYPVLIGDTVQGAVALEISARSQVELQTAMRQLQWGIAWVQGRLGRQADGESTVSGQGLATVLELVGVALEEPKSRSAATGVATELASRLDCDRVSVGFFKRGRVRVHAMSHSAEFRKQMNLMRAIETAMAESTDQQATIVHPDDVASGKNVAEAHRELARIHGDGAACTVPVLDHEGKAFGAFTFERSVDTPFDANALALCESASAVLGPILDEKRRNDRMLIAKAGDSLKTQVHRLIGPRHALRKLIAIVLVLLAVFCVFARGQYRIAAETTLEGEVLRVVAAPFQGFIAEAPVRGGDVVAEGQTLCTLDVRDLRLEYSRWSTEREQYAVEHRRAMAEGDRAAMNVLTKKMAQAEARLGLLDEQISRATITAPFEGVVVSGDLSQSLGAPVDTGQVLFEVAPLDAYRVMLRVDERDIDRVEEGQTGELILTAMPGDRFDFKVTRITPISETEEGRSFFAVEGALDEVSDRLRPGMEGYGKIDVGRRRLIWIWTHQLVDWVRIKFWSWLP